MRFIVIALSVCACTSICVADVSHLKAAKAKFAASLLHGKHHKRGIFSAVPPFKLGHDIPLVTHSLVKPLVVTYPPTAAVTAVKVPLSPPHYPKYPHPVGHKVPVPHPHYGLKFPHHTKSVVVSKPDSHFHHHHHHVAPRPVVPLVPAPVLSPAAPLVPVAQPTVTVAQPAPAPAPPVLLHAASAPLQPVPVSPPPINILPPDHEHLKPAFPISPLALHHPAASVFNSPIYPIAQQYPYVIRPGNAVQTSFYASYPRYPLLNYQSPLIPLTAPAAPAHLGQVLYERPEVPQLNFVPQAAVAEGVVDHHLSHGGVDSTHTLLHPTQAVPQPALHFHPTQPALLDHNGWSPVPADGQVTHTPEDHYQLSSEGVFPHAHDSHHFTQEQGTQVFEQHTGEEQYHDYQHQLEHHIQQQIEQAQYEQHLNNQHQLSHEYGAPEHGGQEYQQHGQEYTPGAEYGVPQQQQPVAEYGAPQQGLEGRSAEGGDESQGQLYHNHIPLGLQPPIDRPLDHFR